MRRSVREGRAVKDGGSERRGKKGEKGEEAGVMRRHIEVQRKREKEGEKNRD